MPRIAIADSFLSALAALDAVSTKRVAVFLDRLVRQPDTASLHLENIHEAADKRDRSLRVTDHLRAIAHLEGDQMLLVFVGEHERAYRWARDHCVECRPTTSELRIVTPSAPTPPTEGGWYCTVENSHQLCHVLDDADIDHGLPA